MNEFTSQDSINIHEATNAEINLLPAIETVANTIFNDIGLITY